MKLHEWLNLPGNTQQLLAIRLTKLRPEKPVTQGAISQWRDPETGKYQIPDRRVLHVENATNNKVTRHESRPDLYPDEGQAA